MTETETFARMTTEDLELELAIQLGKLTEDRSALLPNRWGATDGYEVRAEIAAIESALRSRGAR